MRKTLNFNTYQDKILAAWLGKSIGGTIGAALENHKERKDLTIDKLWPDEIPPNDDMDIQIVWFEALQEKGCYLTQEDLVWYWQDRCWYHFCEYGFFLYNVQRGIMPPLSGRWGNDFFCESEGCPIRSDIWGLVCPGNPELAASFARNDGELDHSGYSVHAEMFYAAMTAQALAGGTLEDIIESGLSVLPADSPVRDTVSVVRKIHHEIADFAAAWRVMMRRFGNRDASKAVTNLAIVMLAFFRSGGDFAEAMLYCANSGWDTDCTAATLGAIIGAWKGTGCIPEEWRKKLGPDLFCAVEIAHKNTPLTDLSHETALLGVEMAQTRNPDIAFEDAPAVSVRPPAPARVKIRAHYPENPVLYARKTTTVELELSNPYDRELSGILTVTPPDNVLCEPSDFTCQIPANGSSTVQLRVRRINPELPLPDKNLFRAEFKTAEDTFSDIFGLGGARQFLVYGPYWNMYNVEKYGDKCPYLYPKAIHPTYAGCNSDSYREYQYLDYPYLDEEKLLSADLPEEMPYHLESATDLIRGAEFGGWHGSCCRYLVREFTLPEGQKICFNLGRTGYMKVWLDGKEICRGDELHPWMLGESDFYRFTATGKKQRLVVKLVNPTDEAALAIYFLHDCEHHPKRGISYLTDDLVDTIPQGYDL